MTTINPTTHAGHYRLSNAIRSEVLKLTSLRSSQITLGVTLVFTFLVSILSATSELHKGALYYQQTGFDPTHQVLTSMIAAVLTGGVFGALLITGEYASGTMRTTLTALPRRPLLLAAKLGVTAAALIGVCELLCFAVFLIGQAILAGGDAPSATLASHAALRAVAFTGLGVPLMALMAFGFGLIFRSTAGAIAGFAGVIFVVPLVVHNFWQGGVRFMPPNILNDSLNSTVANFGGPYAPLSPVAGLAMLALYALVPLVIGSVLFLKRDA
jgi:ABC-2 type transport system permease protein